MLRVGPVNNVSHLILFELSLCFKRVVAEKQEKRNQERLKRREEREREEREKLRRYGLITGVVQVPEVRHSWF